MVHAEKWEAYCEEGRISSDIETDIIYKICQLERDYREEDKDRLDYLKRLAKDRLGIEWQHD